LTLSKFIVERVVVITFGVSDLSCDGAGCFVITVRTDAEFVNVIMAAFVHESVKFCLRN